VQVGGLLGYQQHEQQVDRFAIRRVKRDRATEADEYAGGFFQALYPAMRYGNALAQAG